MSPQNIRQNESNAAVAPNVIKQVYMPPQSPKEVAALIESTLVYQNAANYEMAVKTLEEARDKWR